MDVSGLLDSTRGQRVLVPSAHRHGTILPSRKPVRRGGRVFCFVVTLNFHHGRSSTPPKPTNFLVNRILHASFVRSETKDYGCVGGAVVDQASGTGVHERVR